MRVLRRARPPGVAGFGPRTGDVLDAVRVSGRRRTFGVRVGLAHGVFAFGWRDRPDLRVIVGKLPVGLRRVVRPTGLVELARPAWFRRVLLSLLKIVVHGCTSGLSARLRFR
jgi:hypothetical protein